MKITVEKYVVMTKDEKRWLRYARSGRWGSKYTLTTVDFLVLPEMFDLPELAQEVLNIYLADKVRVSKADFKIVKVRFAVSTVRR